MTFEDFLQQCFRLDYYCPDLDEQKRLREAYEAGYEAAKNEGKGPFPFAPQIQPLDYK